MTDLDRMVKLAGKIKEAIEEIPSGVTLSPEEAVAAGNLARNIIANALAQTLILKQPWVRAQQ